MGYYILAVDELSSLARYSRPNRYAVMNAARGLGRPVVAAYPPFTEEEVRLIGAYRRIQSHEATDMIWQSIALGRRLAWPFAIHEATELQALYDLGSNPFSTAFRDEDMIAAHKRAAVAEDQFLSAWAADLGIVAPPTAIEIENPIRRWFPSHAGVVDAVREAHNRAEPTAVELASARVFWAHIVDGG